MQTPTRAISARSKAYVLRYGVVLAVIALTSACTNPLVGERGSSSCDLRTASPPEQTCTDYSSVGVGQDSFKNTCQAKKATIGSSCDRTGALGGCNEKNTDNQDNDRTQWYFPAPDVQSADDVKKLCGSRTFVAP